MAKSSTAVAPRRNTLPVDWEKQMKEDAARGRAAVAGIGVSQRIKTRGGIMSYMDQPLPGNKMPAVILDASFENALYEGEFDSDNPSSPICFAFGRDEKTLVPHPDSPKKQAVGCFECKHNKWGSAEKGRGKACKNQVHLVVMHGDSLKKPGEIDSAATVTANVPPTSLPSWASFVKQLEENSGKPTYAYVTEMGIVPDQKTQWKWVFSPLKEIEKKVLAMVFPKARAAAKEADERPPYQPMDAAGKAGAKKPGAKKKF